MCKVCTQNSKFYVIESRKFCHFGKFSRFNGCGFLAVLFIVKNGVFLGLKIGSILRVKNLVFRGRKNQVFWGLIFEHFLMYRFCRVSNPGGGKTSILRVQNLGFGGSKYRLFGCRCMGIHAFGVSKRGFLGILWDSRIKF